MAKNILHEIVETKRKEVAAAIQCEPVESLIEQIEGMPRCRNFYKALTRTPDRAVNLIAEAAGPRGTVVEGMDDLRAALQGIELGEVPVLIQAGADHFRVAASLLALVREQGLDPRILRGRVGCDPVAGLAADGDLSVSVDRTVG